MSGPPQYGSTVPHLQLGSAALSQPRSRRRLCLSELDVNVPNIRRACSLQQSETGEHIEPYKPHGNVTDEWRSSLLLPPIIRDRRRYASAQSENDHPLLSHEEVPIRELNPRLRLHSQTPKQPVYKGRYPSFNFDGPGDRQSEHALVEGHSEAGDTSNEGGLPSSRCIFGDGHDIEWQPYVEVSHGDRSDLQHTSGAVSAIVAKSPELSETVHIGASDRSTVSSMGLSLHLKSPRKRPDFTAGNSGDRFVHARRPGLEMRDSFVLSRSPSGLDQRQRMLRRRTGLTDPLGPSSGHPAARANDVENQQQRLVANPHAPTQLTLRPDLDGRPNLFHQVGLPSRRTNSTFGTPRMRTVSGRGNDGQGRMLSSGSIARYHAPKFLDKRLPIEDTDLYEKRLALALDLDLSTKVLGSSSSSSPSSPRTPSTPASSLHSPKARLGPAEAPSRTVWHDNEWRREGVIALLEADGLRDDFYCSILAYSHRADCLAVGLGSKAYLWNEERGLIHPPPQLEVHPPVHRPAYITSLAFSSEAGGKAILALGRVDGRLMLWSPLDTEPRFMPLTMPHSAAHISFRPQTIRRQSQRHESMMADNEVLLVGDDYGNVWVFLVEWPKEQDRFLYGWDGGLALIAKIDVHVQQICGIAWSSDGEYFSTGGNDNLCCLFQANVLFGSLPNEVASTMSIRRDASGSQFVSLGPNGMPHVLLGLEHVRHSWRLTAAVKAMAFCPWQRGLLAAGGGSNDRCIHFYHTMSGACLATIDCAAQVTSLIWSSNRREIAATLGFPQPEHPYRIVVYAWPSCEQVVAIPWHDEMRALYAIPYPGGPNEKRRHSQDPEAWRHRTGDEECMVVAGSDGSIKFHEIWSKDRTAVGPGKGLLGGSDILESLHGIEKEFGETIR